MRSPLFYKVQDVITQTRLIKEKTQGAAPGKGSG